MLKNRLAKGEGKLSTHGFIVAIEMEEGTAIEPLTHKLAGALTWVEGVGQIDVDYLGEITLVDESPDEALDGEVVES